HIFNKLDDNFVFTTEAHIFPLTAQYWKKTWKYIDNFTCDVYKNSKKLASSILERSDADFARELVGFEDLSLPPLDPYGYCEVPYMDPVIIDVSFGESSHETSVQDGQLVIHVQHRGKN
ncbi:14256_t:CDS:2, partial [Racocetra persica]